MHAFALHHNKIIDDWRSLSPQTHSVCVCDVAHKQSNHQFNSTQLNSNKYKFDLHVQITFKWFGAAAAFLSHNRSALVNARFSKTTANVWMKTNHQWNSHMRLWLASHANGLKTSNFADCIAAMRLKMETNTHCMFVSHFGMMVAFFCWFVCFFVYIACVFRVLVILANFEHSHK